MVTEIEAIHKVLAVLEESGIEYMIVGSYAAGLHGFIRTTHDLDLVVCLEAEHVSTLVSALDEEFYVDSESAREAIAQHDMFNIIHFDAGLKIDFWILHNDEYSQAQFARRECAEMEGIPAWVATAEDTILSKLLWYRTSPSERQLDDVRGILEVQKGSLDWDYLNEWAAKLWVAERLADLGKRPQE